MKSSELGNGSTFATTCHLGNSNFTGTIPSELGTLTYLAFLELNKNALSGTIRPELGQLTEYDTGDALCKRTLHLQYNYLVGTIPTELGQLFPITNLDSKSNNAFSGTIPSELGQKNNLFFNL